ncbi:MAG: hypothetical protein IC227_06490 [Enterococcus lacertideformus]|uniref:Uncharacterized protein n=1 Tax=Enterococcus lacertideformus TaxID=2771493 RepID=A0A931AYF7_9ENTE|nr:hypothetical protein [Enterococcus lacertideformus]
MTAEKIKANLTVSVDNFYKTEINKLNSIIENRKQTIKNLEEKLQVLNVLPQNYAEHLAISSKITNLKETIYYKISEDKEILAKANKCIETFKNNIMVAKNKEVEPMVIQQKRLQNISQNNPNQERTPNTMSLIYGRDR